MAEKTVYSEAVKIVTLCIAWYTFSAANNVLGKKIFTIFPYPLTLSMSHYLALAAFLGPTLSLLNVEPAPYMSKRFYMRRIVPLAAGKILASFTSHLSILKVPVSYAHTVKAMMPIFTVFLTTCILHERYSKKVYLSLVPIVVGVLIATVTELRFDMMGLVAALVATLSFALQNIYSKKCMRDTGIHHLRLLLSLSQLGCVMLLPIWLYTDVWDIIPNLHKVTHLSWLALVLPLNGFLIFAQNIVAFSIISAVSPVSYSVANSTKRVVVISASLLLLQNPVTFWNVFGMLVAIGGVACYNKVKIDEKRAKMLLPLTTSPSSSSHSAHMELSSLLPSSPANTADIKLATLAVGGPESVVLSQRPHTHEHALQSPLKAIV